MVHRRQSFYEKHSLPLLSGFLLLSCVAYFPLSAGPILADLPEIAIPIGVTAVLVVYTLRLLQREYLVDDIKQVALYGWTGALVASFGAWWLLQHIQRELSVTILFDEVLTVVSIGTGLGVFIGAHLIHEYRAEPRENTHLHATDRDRVLGEIGWTNEPQPNPILSAITTQIAEIEGVEPLELDPLHEHVNPDVFTELHARDDSQWQLLFYTDEYEVRVSAQGTVTIYDLDDPSREHGIRLSPGSER